MQPANFRDVGEALSLWLDPSPIPARRLLRGGKFDHLSSLDDLGQPQTILNLRRGPDPVHLGVRIVHVPAADDVENYNTRQRPVRDWLTRALEVLAKTDTAWPVYVHCTSGRDRTGVVIAAALVAIGVPREIVAEEYMLSDRADRPSIELALDGILAAPPINVSSLRIALGCAG
jgi:protein-tyrosine phosphatase